ncbi:MAG: hypothetical protein ACFB0E_13480 [Leptolyngbyaceae cyanobacterium]
MSSNALVFSPSPIIPAVEGPALPIEVGVFPDGTPFMSGRELARACGISNSTLVGWGEVSPQVGDRYRAGKLAGLLATYQYQGDRLFVRLPNGAQFGGRANVSAYPYQVCLAFLDYYAFEADKTAARDSLRLLSEQQLPQFICEAVSGVTSSAPPISPSPQKTAMTSAAKRPQRNGVPVGYFSVEQIESSTVGRSLPVTPFASLPLPLVINIAKAWSRYWTVQQLGKVYGDRLPLPSKSTPTWSQPWQYAYPKAAWQSFQHWFSGEYLPDRFPSYQQRQRHQQRSASAYLHLLPQSVLSPAVSLNELQSSVSDRQLNIKSA